MPEPVLTHARVFSRSWSVRPLVLLAFATALCAHFPAHAAEAPAPDTTGSLVQVTAFTVPFRELDVASGTGGILASLPVDEGSEVQEGQVLAEFKAEVLRAEAIVSGARARAAEYELQAAEATYEVSKDKCKRAEELFTQNVMSDVQYLEAKLDVEVARLNVESAKARKQVLELVAARDQEALRQRVIHAPVSGQVFRIHKRPGEAVEVNGPILRLVTVDPLYVVAYVPITTAGDVAVGDTATFALEGSNGAPLECTVAVVDAVADTASSTYRVKLTLPNPDRKLMAGAKGTLSLRCSD